MAKHFLPSTITKIVNLFAPVGVITLDPTNGLFVNGELVTPEELATMLDSCRKTIHKPREKHNCYFIGNEGPFSYREAKARILDASTPEERARLEDKNIRPLPFLDRLNILDERNHLIREVPVGAVVTTPEVVEVVEVAEVAEVAEVVEVAEVAEVAEVVEVAEVAVAKSPKPKTVPAKPKKPVAKSPKAKAKKAPKK